MKRRSASATCGTITVGRVLGTGLAALCAILLGAAQVGAARAAELKCFCSPALKGALESLEGDISQALGQPLSIRYDATPVIRKNIQGGEPFDVAITVPANVDELTRSGYLLPVPRAVVGVTVASVAYREGAPEPQVAGDAALKAFVLSAPAISLSDPAKGGASSNFFMSAMRRLNLTPVVDGKLVLTEPGDGAVPVAAGKVPYAIALTSEIAGKPGIKGVPLLPSDLAGTFTFIASVSAKSAQGDAARAFIAFLSTPKGLAARKAAGLMAGAGD